MSPDQVELWIQHFSYPAVLALLLACGLGAPLSEDLILISAGLVVARTGGPLPWMIAIGYVGALAGDLMLMRIGRRLGPKVTEAPRFRKLFTADRVQWLERHFQKWGTTTVFVARLIPGLRMVTFLTAGVSRLSPVRFVIADGLAALITVPLMVLLGHRFGKAVLGDVEVAGRWLLAVAALIAAGALVTKWVRSRRRPLTPQTKQRLDELAR